MTSNNDDLLRLVKAQRDGKTKVETKNKMSEEGLKMKKLDEGNFNISDLDAMLKALPTKL